MASYLRDHVVPLLIGRDARRIEDTWQYLYKGAYWRRGPVTMTAIAAVDMALWDILGKAAERAGLPAAGRRVARRRDGLRPRQRRRPSKTPCGAVADYIRLGYKAVRAQSGVPGLATRLRRRPGTSCTTSRPRRAAARGSLWSTERYLDFVPPLFAPSAARASGPTSTCSTTCTTA